MPPELKSPAREWQWGWVLAVVANLAVPLLFGLFFLSAGGILGMLAGVVTVWLTGHIAIARVPRVGRTLVYSSGLFALSQVLPVAQYAAGSAALELCAGGPHTNLPAATAFLVTVVTAAVLLGAALLSDLLARVCGPVVRPLGQFLAGHPNRPSP